MFNIDNGAGWTDMHSVSAPFQRAIVVTFVSILHITAVVAWMKSHPHNIAPKPEMEVAILLAPAIVPAVRPALQPPPRFVHFAPSRDERAPAPLPPAEVLREHGVSLDRPEEAAIAGMVMSDIQPAAQEAEPEVEPDFKASYLNNRLVYPLSARRMGIQGRVVLDVEVLADGLCGNIDVAQSSGHDVLDQAAMESVRTWHFMPARHGAQAVTRWFKVPIRFSLKDDGA